MSRPNDLIFAAVTVYFVAMVMLMAYLFYARFSPEHQKMYSAPTTESRSITPDHPAYCLTSDDCVVDSCNGCQVLNRQNVNTSNICLIDCQLDTLCFNHQCMGIPQ